MTLSFSYVDSNNMNTTYFLYCLRAKWNGWCKVTMIMPWIYITVIFHNFTSLSASRMAFLGGVIFKKIENWIRKNTGSAIGNILLIMMWLFNVVIQFVHYN